MTRQRARFAWSSGALAALLALATGGMAVAPPDGPVRLSNYRIDGLGGFAVIDSAGLHIGQVIRIEADRRGQARWIHVALDRGGETKVASFRAWMDAAKMTIALQLPEDIVLRRMEAEALSSLSAGT